MINQSIRLGLYPELAVLDLVLFYGSAVVLQEVHL